MAIQEKCLAGSTLRHSNVNVVGKIMPKVWWNVYIKSGKGWPLYWTYLSNISGCLVGHISYLHYLDVIEQIICIVRSAFLGLNFLFVL